MKDFYCNLFGWKPLKLNGFILSLFSKKELADDAGVSASGSGFRGFTLAYNLRSEKEVDKLMDFFNSILNALRTVYSVK